MTQFWFMFLDCYQSQMWRGSCGFLKLGKNTAVHLPPKTVNLLIMLNLVEQGTDSKSTERQDVDGTDFFGYRYLESIFKKHNI